MNTLIITCMLNAEQSVATFGSNPSLDIFYLPKDKILEFYDSGVYLFPICFEEPLNMPENQKEVYNKDLYKSCLDEFRRLFVGENSSKEDQVVTILLETSDFEDIIEIFHNEIRLPADWNIQVFDATEDETFMPYDLCVVPSDVFEKATDLYPMYLCPFAEFISGLVHENRKKAQVKKLLSDKQIQKRRGLLGKKREAPKRHTHAVVSKNILLSVDKTEGRN